MWYVCPCVDFVPSLYFVHIYVWHTILPHITDVEILANKIIAFSRVYTLDFDKLKMQIGQSVATKCRRSDAVLPFTGSAWVVVSLVQIWPYALPIQKIPSSTRNENFSSPFHTHTHTQDKRRTHTVIHIHIFIKWIILLRWSARSMYSICTGVRPQCKMLLPRCLIDKIFAYKINKQNYCRNCLP